MNGDGRACPAEFTCGLLNQYPDKKVLLKNVDIEDDGYINYGIPIFDNLILAFVAIIQMVTLEGWSTIMYLLADSSQSWLAYFFCILIVVIGSFFLLNVILAVLSEEIEKDKEDEKAKLEMKKYEEFIDMCKYFKIDDPEVQKEDEAIMN